MTNKRRFHRIRLSAQATVHYLDNDYEGILGAISLGGASINFNDSAMIPHGDHCSVSVVLDKNQPALRFDAKITNSSFYRIGVAFINMDDDTAMKLYSRLKELTSEPEKLTSEMQLFIAIH